MTDRKIRIFSQYSAELETLKERNEQRLTELEQIMDYVLGRDSNAKGRH